MSHFLVECPSKPYGTFGGVCMPDYNYEGLKSMTKYNGPGPEGKDYYKLWNENQQCMANDCVTITSRADCDSNPSLQPCVCYDSCPSGPTYYPIQEDWGIKESDQTERDLYLQTILVHKPCSARGACTH